MKRKTGEIELFTFEGLMSSVEASSTGVEIVQCPRIR